MNKLRWKKLAGLGLAALAAGGVQAQAPAPSSVEIFGDLSVGVVHSSGTSGPSNYMQSSLAWANALGFRGREDLGGGTSAIFALVSSVDVDTGAIGNTAAFFKNSYVGLSDVRWGTLTVGRNDELMSMLCSLDVMCWRGIIHGLRPGNVDRVGGAQLSNMIRYNSPDLGPFRFKSYVTLGEKATTPNGRASGVQADYRSGGLQIGAAYERINNGTFSPASPATGIGVTSFLGTAVTPASSILIDSRSMAGLGARYATGPITFYGLVTQTNFKAGTASNSYKSYNLGAAYQVNAPMDVAAGCTRSTFTPSKWTECQVRLTYSFSKRTSVYIADVHQTSSGPFARPQLFLQGGAGSVGGSTNVIAAGVRHVF